MTLNFEIYGFGAPPERNLNIGERKASVDMDRISLIRIFFAAFLILSLPPIFFSTIKITDRKKFILAPLLLTGVLALIITYTRGSYIAIAAGCFFILFYGLFNVITLKKTISITVVLLASIVILFPAAFEKIQDRFSTMQNEEEVESSRVEIWKNAMQIWFQHPLIGVGLSESDYQVAASKISGINAHQTKFGHTVEGFMDQPHNSYISLAVWVSSFAVIVFLWIIIKILKLGKKVIRDPITPEFYKVFCFSCGMAIFSFIVMIFFDTQLFIRGDNLLFWGLCGLVVSVYRRYMFSIDLAQEEANYIEVKWREK